MCATPFAICLRYLYIMVSLRHDGMTLKLDEAEPMLNVELLKLGQNLSSLHIGTGRIHYGASIIYSLLGDSLFAKLIRWSSLWGY